jgi:hypothetical protein
MKLSNKTASGKPPTKIFGMAISGKKASKVPEIDPETFVFAPELPKVNVIPQHVTEKYEVKGLIRKLAFAGIGVIGVFTLVFIGGQAYTGILNNKVTEIQAEEQALNTQVATLTPYEQYKTAVSGKRTALSQEVSTDVNVGSIYGDMYTTANSFQLELTSISIAQQDESGLETGGCTSPDPFNETANVIGCITFQGSGNDAQGSKKFVEALVGISDPVRYASPFISGIATSEEGITTFEASISFTSELYTAQYASLETALDEVLAGNPTGGETPAVENNGTEEVAASYDSAVTTTAQNLVPSLTASDLTLIDTSASQACTVNDSSTQLESIRSVIQSKLPANNANNLEEIMSNLTDTLDTECGGSN